MARSDSSRFSHASLLVLAVALVGTSMACYRRGNNSNNSDNNNDSNNNGTDAQTDPPAPAHCENACGLCGDPIDVTLVFNNAIREPTFHFNVTVTSPRRELIHFLQRAAVQDNRARFVATYWGSLGYYIDSINKAKANYSLDKSYWKIIEHVSGNGLDLGVSSYIPMHQEAIQFNLTTYSSH